MYLLLVALAAFVGVAALVGGLALLLRDQPAAKIEDRLDLLTGLNTPAAAKEALLKGGGVLAEPLDDSPNPLVAWVKQFGSLNRLFEQADTSLSVGRFLAISAAMGAGGIVISLILRLPFAMIPLAALGLAVVPLFWLLLRRRKRMKAFAVQLPDALEMLARALRAGQSLAAGFSNVAQELPPPLGKEFGRVFEEQNLGISLDDSLEGLTERVPNLDLKFFATALILQRQTGGDLAEILDKIGRLIRERFQIWGQVQALTGEGRLSGIVLLALPVVLFLVVYHLNTDYVMVLFTDPMGKQMLVAAVVMQLVGALVIRKIVNIEV